MPFKKLSYEYVKEKIEKEGYTLLSKEYINSHFKLKIKCPLGHEYETKFYVFNQGHGCPICFGTPKHTYEYVKEQIEKEGYILLSKEYKGNKSKLKVKCPEGHEYEVRYDNFRNGQRCRKCKYINQSNKQKNSYRYIKEKIEKEGYILLSKEYKNAHLKLKVKCPEGHEYKVRWNDFRNGNRCPRCCNKISDGEKELSEYLKSLDIEVKENCRSLIYPLELDIVITDKKIAIEYCGLYWHSEKFLEKNYHLNKLNLCNEAGYRLITIFEDEWLFKKEIVKSRLRYILGLNNERIYARNCKIKEITINEAKKFLDIYHIQGYIGSSVKLGAFHNEELVAVMTFRKNSNKIFELNRFCTSFNVIGIASKLLKYFERNYEWNKIYTFADRRWSEGNLYEKLKMIEEGKINPDYSYFKGQNRYHKFGFRHKQMKNKLENYNSNLSERKNMLNNDWLRIYDCGKIKYEKKRIEEVKKTC